MTVILTVNGSSYDYPERGDTSWGPDATDWASAVTSGMLQKAGGTFTLTSDVNFGASYGLASAYFKSRTSNVASAGQIRLAVSDVISFRNNANSANLDLGVDSLNRLSFNGANFLISGSIVNADINASAAIAYSKLSLVNSILNADINASAAIAYSKLNLSTSILNSDVNASAAIAYSKLAPTTASRALVSDGSGFISASSITATELGYLSGLTSSAQTQISDKLPLGGGTLSGVLAMSSQKITGLATPTADTDAANKQYVDSLATGISVKTSCRVATTVAGTLATSFENGDTIDGVVLATNDRILIKNQAAPAENGIYVVQASGAPVRATDANTWAEMIQAYVLMTEGSTQQDTGWKADAVAGGTLGVTAINWAQFTVAASVTAGVAINLTGSLIDVKYDNSTIGINGSNELIVKALGVADAQVASGAAIAYSKLAATTASRALVSDGSGFVSASSITATELGYLSGVTSAIQTQINNGAFSSNRVVQSSTASGIGFSFSVAASALTINLKQIDGSTDCDASNPAQISFRSSTLATGSVLNRSVTGALSMVVTSGATLGGNDAADEFLYLYAIDNAGTVELAISASYHWDEGQRYTTTAMSSSADNAGVLYSTTARTNVAIRLIGRIKSNQTTAGTWAATPSEVCGNSFTKELVIAKTASFNAKHGYIYTVTTGAARTISLPTPASGIYFKIKDVSGTANTNNITLARSSAESIEGVAGNKTLQTNWGSWTVFCDGTNWFLV